MFLQLFNMINCRKIGRRDFNVFESFFHNWYFIGLFTLIAVVQFGQTNYFYDMSQTVPLSKSEWGSCIAVGSTSLIISAIIKLLPDDLLEKLPLIKKGEAIEDEEMTNTYLEKAKSKMAGSEATGSAAELKNKSNDGDDDNYEKA